MGDARFLPGLALVGVTAALAVFVLLLVGLSWPGRRRAGLIAGALPLALLPVVTATAYASWRLVGVFSGLTQDQPGAALNLLEPMGALWAIQRVAWGTSSAACALGLALGFWRSEGATDNASCSARRGLVLLLLPAIALAVAGLTTRPLVKALRVSAAIVSSVHDDPASQVRTESVLEAEGVQARGAGSIAAAATNISRAMMTGLFGGATAAVVLVGLALPGFILAWRVRFGATFTALSSLTWLLAAAAAALVAAGVVDPLRLA
jgi:hypothetical protein